MLLPRRRVDITSNAVRIEVVPSRTSAMNGASKGHPLVSSAPPQAFERSRLRNYNENHAVLTRQQPALRCCNIEYGIHHPVITARMHEELRAPQRSLSMPRS
ncbi:hypothetical protein RB195_007199 [Necator americanus]|uniref:Uncharacterized protein n=1 Tax=Necator americanus TaxID=51031 RepID=A0ABR1BW33_NECAM